MGRKPTNNPRQIPSMVCGCPTCIEKFHPDRKSTRRDCTGTWQYRYTGPDGRGTSLNRPTYDEAVADGQRAATEVRSGTWIDPKRSKITLNAWWDIWWPLQSSLVENTLDRDERSWRNHIQPAFGHWQLGQIGWSDVQAWVNSLDGPLAPSSVVKAFQILHRMLTAALRDRRLPYNPSDGVKMPKMHKKHPEDKRPPTYAQLRLVRKNLPRYHVVLQILAQETGLRWGELAGLRACWVDLENARIQVREVLTEVKGTLRRKAFPKGDAGQRTVPLTPLAVRVLRSYMEAEQPAATKSGIDDGMHPEELLFHGPNRRNGVNRRAPLRRTVFRRTWINAITRAGIVRRTVRKLPGGKTRTAYWPSFHDQRHTFASRLANLGVPEVIVQEVLGHERAGQVTWLYTHAAADVAGQVLAALTDRSAAQRPHLRVVRAAA